MNSIKTRNGSPNNDITAQGSIIIPFVYVYFRASAYRCMCVCVYVARCTRKIPIQFRNSGFPELQDASPCSNFKSTICCDRSSELRGESLKVFPKILLCKFADLNARTNTFGYPIRNFNSFDLFYLISTFQDSHLKNSYPILNLNSNIPLESNFQ